jgi:hypothetical protein
MRTHGSARFAPYFKVQYWDALNCAWHDVQQAHPTPEAAQAAYLPGQRCRTMQVTMHGRAPLPAAPTATAAPR